jgi:hypothetical protein
MFFPWIFGFFVKKLNCMITLDQFLKHDTLKSMADLCKVSTKTLSGRIKNILPQYQNKKIGKLYPGELKRIYNDLFE